ncbi:hypothetical protein FPQ18DRAFT_286107 [Pyronema domesticum]|nr:hypothetical protein FPQ18DRAFT_286107 [Pyronema domesticum]
MSTGDMQSTPFLKQLVASDRPTRDKAVAALRSYLTATRTFSKMDLLKLWKGLFYCYWHSDRPRFQQSLSADLASLLLPMSPTNALTFYRAFWETMTREWSGIDVLRIDKFLMLIRRYFAVGLRYCKERAWDVKILEELVVETMEQIPLDPKNQKLPAGVRIQLSDIWTEEIAKVLGEGATNGKLGEEQITLLVRPWEKMARDGAQKLWRTRAKELLAEEVWVEWGYTGEFAKKEEPVEDEEEEEWGGFA